MSRFPRRLLADGSYCYSGPACRKHGSVPSAPVTTTGDSPVNNPNRKRTILTRGDANWVRDLCAASNAFREKVEALPGADRYGALQLYTSVGHETINAYLRKQAGEAYDEKAYDLIRGDDSRVRSRIEHIDEALSHAVPLPDNSVPLYRAEPAPNPQPGSTLLQALRSLYPVGHEFTPASYFSTSADPDYMAFFARRKRKRESFILEIQAQKGAPVLPERGNGEYRTGHLQSFEREVLLPRETKYRVLSVEEAVFENDYPSEVRKFYELPKRYAFCAVKVQQLP